MILTAKYRFSPVTARLFWFIHVLLSLLGVCRHMGSHVICRANVDININVKIPYVDNSPKNYWKLIIWFCSDVILGDRQFFSQPWGNMVTMAYDRMILSCRPIIKPNSWGKYKIRKLYWLLWQPCYPLVEELYNCYGNYVTSWLKNCIIMCANGKWGKRSVLTGC